MNDDIIIGLLHSRINQTDCLLQGYVIDGFPKTEGQIKSVHEQKINPSFVFLMDIEDRVCKERLRSKKIDPVTGVIYTNVQIHGLKDEAIINRLQVTPSEAPDRIDKR